MGLAHQEPVKKLIKGNKSLIKEFKIWIQWIHNKTEYKLKKLLKREQKLELKKEKHTADYNKALKELNELQSSGAMNIANKLLFTDEQPKLSQNKSARILRPVDSSSKDSQYLSYSDSDDEGVRVPRCNITTCSSSQSKLVINNTFSQQFDEGSPQRTWIEE